MLRRESVQRAHGSSVQAVHPLLGAHVHLREEPERHVWQGEVGTDAHPWLADHQIHGVAAFPGAGYCEMALAAAAATLGERAEVRDVTFEQTLLLAGRTEVSSTATVTGPGGSSSPWTPTKTASASGGPARSCTPCRQSTAARPGRPRTTWQR
ncbi:mycocerosic acid synthase domain protein [Mycobacterium avium subsp. avium 2285 (R)]|nr:mycocerosic acid synthase domain protein [Mycobacterium avium subsp. avium 2285 (R)]